MQLVNRGSGGGASRIAGGRETLSGGPGSGEAGRSRLAPSGMNLIPVGPADGATPCTGDPFMVSSPTRVRSAGEVRGRVGRLIEMVQAGQLLCAVQDFYAPDVKLGQGAQLPMFGLDTRAGKVWSSSHRDAEWCRFDVKGVGVNGDTSFVECVLGFESAAGSTFEMEQVAVSQWRGGLIVKECLIPIHRH